MSDWYWRALALKTAFVVTCLFSYIYAQDTIEKLPYCNPHNSGDSPVSNDLLIVSTLDGKLTAFSTQNGFKAWDLETQPLLSSNLHHVELSSGGKWVRLVPSLRGTLYSLSGDTIEPLPFDAEQLLSSSFKYSDDLVVAGARETLWIGLDSSSGTVLYECSSSGCSNEQQSATGSRFVLVLRRLANTVRALDPRSGLEKWNFSVAEHQLAISTNRECHIPNKGPVPAATVVVALPEGTVALRAPDSKLLLWQQKLEAPVAGMWRLHGDSLQPIDILWEGSKSLTESAVLQAPPSIYIGVHEKQLYIQEGSAYGAKLDTAVGSKRSPFKLQQTRPLLASDSAPESNAVSLVTLYGNTGLSENRGFFLYLQDSTCDQAVQVSDETVDDSDYFPPNDSTDQSEHHHIHVHVYSLWFWWKEVLLIAVSSALLMNLMIWPRFFAPKFRPATPLPLNKEYIVVERHYERPVVNTGTEYSGRYEKDFTPLRCLGRGGFGVVFEAKNNIDHCSYAVKRITLPKRESKRERVLREVRALAKLEHENIVRYFNAWVEEPPPGWQDQRDAIWMRELDGVSVSMSEDYTASSPLPQKKPPADTTLDLQGGLRALTPPGVDPCFDALDFEKQLTSKRHRSFSCNDSFSIVFDENASKHGEGKHSSNNLSNVSTKVASADDDSFIVFANSHDLSKHSSNVHELANKQLEVVKRSDDYTKTSETHSKNKKGHRRHWSLDLCVKSAGDGTEAGTGTGTGIGTGSGGSNMYLYIQMQLCLRDSLHDWLRQNRTAHQRGDKVKGLFSQIVSAVEYVHLAGLIHRDLKPSNIFFAPDGRVKVGDFGLVTTMAESSSEGCSSDHREAEVHTRHTYRVGTHLYMSPEQLAGRAYSFKVDIYSLGLILLELLQPFNTEAERVATLLRAREQNYPQTFMENYPETAEVLKLMLSADPSLRPTAGGVKSLALQN